MPLMQTHDVGVQFNEMAISCTFPGSSRPADSGQPAICIIPGTRQHCNPGSAHTANNMPGHPLAKQEGDATYIRLILGPVCLSSSLAARTRSTSETVSSSDPLPRNGRLLPPLEGEMMSQRRDTASHHRTQHDNNTNHDPQRSRTYS